MPLDHSRQLTGQANGLKLKYRSATTRAMASDGRLTISTFVTGKSQGTRSGWFTCHWPSTTNSTKAAAMAGAITLQRGTTIAAEPTRPRDEAAWYTSTPPREMVTIAVP